MKIDVSHNLKSVRVKLFELRDEVIEKATIRALKKTANQARTAAAKEIKAAGYNIKASNIKRTIIVKPPRGTTGKWHIVVVCSGRPIPLIQYDARPTSQGVSVNVKAGRKMIKGAFIATMPSTGHTGVFVRVGRQHKKINGKWHGLPIKELFGPSIPAAFISKPVQDALARLIREKFPAILEHEMKYAGR